MNILFVKLTSMGDLIHALPALTDASRAIPNISFDWVIDKNFSEVALWHPAVKNIIPTAHRKWRKNFYQSLKNGEISQFLTALRKEKYDLVIDGQSSLKSAIAMLLSRGPRHGLDKKSARESWVSSIAYQKTYFVDKDMHAIKRLRLLFAQILQYPYPDTQPDYGITDYPFPSLKIDLPTPYLVFVHNASWSSKLWPESHWHQLIEYAAQDGLNVLLPWGNASEKQRAEKIAAGHSNTYVLPFCTLSEQAKILKGSKGAVCSDTGLSHLAAALNVPAVTFYGSTNVKLIGTTGLHQQHLISSFPCTLCYKYDCNYGNETHTEPLCLAAIKPEIVWNSFKQIMTE